MTLKEEMQRNRNEEIERMKEQEVEKAKNKIRKSFLEKQLKDMKESKFKIHIVWYKNDLILDYNEENKLVSGIVPDKAKKEFIESIKKKLEKEEIEMVPDRDSEIAWFLTVELS